MVRPLLAGMLACCAASAAQAAAAWDEAANGDFSNNGLAPTPVAVAAGSNIIQGTTGNLSGGVDRDFFRLTIPAGSVLSSIKVLDSTDIPIGVSFIGIQPGPQVTGGGSAAGLIAYGHFNNNQISLNLLSALQVTPGPPLPAGTYSFWVQEIGDPVSYGLDFVVTSLPIDGDAPLPLWAYALLALLLLAALKKQVRARWA